MRARVYVSLKPSVLDPQGKTICSSLNGMGHTGILDVRQGKYFEVDLGDSLSREAAQSELDQGAKEILANPVIEDYRVELLD